MKKANSTSKAKRRTSARERKVKGKTRSPGRDNNLEPRTELIKDDARAFIRDFRRVKAAIEKVSSDDVRLRDEALSALGSKMAGATRFLVNMGTQSPGELQQIASELSLNPRVLVMLDELRPAIREHRVRLFQALDRDRLSPAKLASTRRLGKRMVQYIREETPFSMRLDAIAALAEKGQNVETHFRQLYERGGAVEEALVRTLASSIHGVEEQASEWGLSPLGRRRLLKWRCRFPLLEAPAYDMLAALNGTSLTWTTMTGRGWLRLRDHYPIVELALSAKGREVFRGSQEYDDAIRMAAVIMERLAAVGDGFAFARELLPPSFVAESCEAMERLMKASRRVDALLRDLGGQRAENRGGA